MFFSRALSCRARVVLLASHPSATRTKSLREPAHPEGGFEAPAWEKSGAASSSSSSLAGKQKEEKKTDACSFATPVSLARAVLCPYEGPFSALRDLRLPSRPSRARFFGRKRRRTRGKGSRAHASLSERGKKKPFAQGKRRRRRKGRRRKRPPPLPVPPTAAAASSTASQLNPSPYLPPDDDDRRQHVPQARQALVSPRDVAERRRGGLQAVDERQDRLHPFGRHF